MSPRDEVLELKARMSRSITGQEHIIERLVVGLLAIGCFSTLSSSRSSTTPCSRRRSRRWAC